MNQNQIETMDAKLERLFRKEKENATRVRKMAAESNAFFSELIKKKNERLVSESSRE